MPRMLILLLAGWLVLVMVSEGAILTRSSKSRIFARSMLTAVATNTELGTDWIFSARLVPVTMTSSSAPLGTGADAAEARSKAKARWQGKGKAHIDALQRIERVDGYDVILQPGLAGDVIATDQTYEPADPG